MFYNTFNKPANHKVLCLLLLLWVVFNSHAQTNTWTGAVDNDWHKRCNWSLDTVPTCSHNVVIPGVTNLPKITGIAHSRIVDILTGGHLEIVATGGGQLQESSLNGGGCTGTATDNSATGCCSGWVQNSDVVLSGTEDSYGIAGDGTNLYVVGIDNAPGNLQWRVEKRLASTGALVTAFGTNGRFTVNPGSSSDVARRAGTDATGLYVGGVYVPSGFNWKWRIQKLDLTTGASAWVQTASYSSGVDELLDMEVAADGIYSVGYDQSPGAGNTQWRLEKRNLSTGTVTWTTNNNPSVSDDIAFGVTVDGSDVYVVGRDNIYTSPSNIDGRWRIEKRSASTGALDVTFGTGGVVIYNPEVGTGTSDFAHHVVADATGIYVVGCTNQNTIAYGIIKFSKTDGSVLWSNSIPAQSIRYYHVGVDATGVYVAGNESAQWIVDKYNLSTGAVICNNSSSVTFPSINDILVSPNGVFVTGKEQPGSQQWRIEKVCCQ